MLKERTTYEIMDATTVGLEANSIVLGKHSGRHALQQALAELGFELAGQSLNTAFKRFKEIADKKKHVTAMDLEALVTDELREEIAGYQLEWFDVEASSRRPPHATVGVRAPDGEELTGSFTGDGPVDAIFRAINAATGERGAAARVPGRRGHRRPGRARRDLGGARDRRRHRLGPGRVDRHPRGRGPRLRPGAVERAAAGVDRRRGRGGRRGGAEPRRVGAGAPASAVTADALPRPAAAPGGSRPRARGRAARGP